MHCKCIVSNQVTHKIGTKLTMMSGVYNWIIIQGMLGTYMCNNWMAPYCMCPRDGRHTNTYKNKTQPQ